MQKHCSRKNDKVYLKESESTLFGIISSVPAIIDRFAEYTYLEKEMVTLVYQQKHFWIKKFKWKVQLRTFVMWWLQMTLFIIIQY